MSRARLSRNFVVEEFDCRDGRRVPADALPGLRALCSTYLEPLRARFGPVRILSGFRSVTHNRSVGGAPRSRHRYDLFPGSPAADFTCARGTPRDWASFLNARGAGGLGTYPGFVHVDGRPGRARW